MFRLLLTYFTGSTAARWFSLGGLVCLAISVVVVTSLPQSEHMLAFSFTGIVGLFLGSAMMPLTLGRLAQSHVASILPYARIKLLASAILTVLIVALPCGLLTPLAYVAGVSGDVSWLARDPKLREYTLQLAFLTYTSCCLIAAWLYLAMWFLTSQRNLAGSAKALLVVVLMLNAPVREIRRRRAAAPCGCAASGRAPSFSPSSNDRAGGTTDSCPPPCYSRCSVSARSRKCHGLFSPTASRCSCSAPS